MAIRIVCPACSSANTFTDDKRGKKVRCAKCEKVLAIPAAKNRDAEAVQEKPKVRVGTPSRDDDDDAPEKRPVPQKKKAAAKGSPMPMLLIGIVAIVLLVCLAGGGSLGALFFLRGKSEPPKNEQVADADAKKPDNKDQNAAEKPPIQKPPPVDDKPLPNELSKELIAKTKQATVYLRVTMPSGQVAEGSGFFALEPGIVITNAHVLGMLGAKSRPPKTVQVVLHSGEANERQLIGNVLGVDRDCDLAVVHVNEPNLPAPLQLEAGEPTETQKVYIFGFPFGAQLGKNITVSGSEVSSLRRDQRTRELDQIQVNGGMHPGNSGGPVVNTGGKLLGVSVAGIRGTQINFAVPAEKVRQIMEGRLADTKHGEAFVQDGRTLLPVHFTCLDPLNRVQKVHVEVWAGSPGPIRPSMRQKPQPEQGDGARQNHAMIYQKFASIGDVPLPAVGQGQVHWVQPVLTTQGGAVIWGPAVPTSIVTPLERRDTDIRVNLTAEKERTVRLKNSASITLYKGNQKKSFAEVLEGEILEELSPNPQGALMRTGIGGFNVRAEEDGRQVRFDPEVPPYLRAIPPQFVVDATNKFRSRVDRSLGNTKMSPLLREAVEDNYAQLCNAIEAVNVPMPNRMMRPTDFWMTEVPMMIQTGKPPVVVDLVMKCTFEGVRSRNQRNEGVCTVTGTLRGRDAHADKISGDITGKIVFDLAGGFISVAQLKISSERSIPGGGEIQIVQGFDIELTRQPGNLAKIVMPVEKGNPGPVAKGNVILNVNGTLAVNDLPEKTPGLRNKGARMKNFPIKMQAGKSYVITLTSAAFDSYLRLENQVGQTVMEDDDGAGFPNAQIVFRCVQSGLYNVAATAYDGKLGAFQLTVHESGPATPPKLNPKGGPLPAATKFEKPAKSANPTNYAKIISTPGDFIGQGKNYDYPAEKIKGKNNQRNLSISIEGWTLDLAGPGGQPVQVGEYTDARRFPFNDKSPGLTFSGNGRGANRISGEFVVWELELNGDQIVRLAVDFVQRAEETGPPLTGKVRINSTLQ